MLVSKECMSIELVSSCEACGDRFLALSDLLLGDRHDKDDAARGLSGVDDSRRDRLRTFAEEFGRDMFCAWSAMWMQSPRILQIEHHMPTFRFNGFHDDKYCLRGVSQLPLSSKGMRSDFGCFESGGRGFATFSDSALKTLLSNFSLPALRSSWLFVIFTSKSFFNFGIFSFAFVIHSAFLPTSTVVSSTSQSSKKATSSVERKPSRSTSSALNSVPAFPS
mmetsp:Transcript_112145/g.175145  ORF Transcript_112145/g.175145 Transcript_112145/m.175145 type:complete len:221 (-) Transcript_112145:401-1063(-)